MTMHIVFQTDKDGYKKDQSCYVERSLARRFCENGVAITYQKHLDNIYDAEQLKIAAKAKVAVKTVEKPKVKKEAPKPTAPKGKSKKITA